MKKSLFALMLSTSILSIVPNSSANESIQQEATSGSTWTVQDIKPASASISTKYLPYATLTNSQENPFLKEILIEVSLHHSKNARALGISVGNLTVKYGNSEPVEITEDYGIRGGPSRLAINFILTNGNLISNMSSFVNETFGESKGMFGHKWTEQYVADNDQKYSCISFPIGEISSYGQKIFDQLAVLGNLTDADKSVLNGVLRDIQKRMN